jgi:hypothetical protein
MLGQINPSYRLSSAWQKNGQSYPIGESMNKLLALIARARLVLIAEEMRQSLKDPK